MRPSRRFIFRLCKELGYAHPDYLLDELNSEQISEWEAYNSLEPIGETRADYRAALIACTITNCFRSAYGKKGSRMMTIGDFLFEWDKQDVDPDVIKRESVEDMRSGLVNIAALLSKKTKKR